MKLDPTWQVNTGLRRPGPWPGLKPQKTERCNWPSQTWMTRRVNPKPRWEWIFLTFLFFYKLKKYKINLWILSFTFVFIAYIYIDCFLIFLIWFDIYILLHESKLRASYLFFIVYVHMNFVLIIIKEYIKIVI